MKGANEEKGFWLVKLRRAIRSPRFGNIAGGRDDAIMDGTLIADSGDKSGGTQRGTERKDDWRQPGGGDRPRGQRWRAGRVDAETQRRRRDRVDGRSGCITAAGG